MNFTNSERLHKKALERIVGEIGRASCRERVSTSV